MLNSLIADTDTKSGGGGTQNAVGDSDVRAGELLLVQRSCISANGDGVVARINNAVADGDKTATVDINAVGVGVGAVVEHVQTAHLNVIAAVEEAAPAGGVLNADILNADMGAFHKADKLSRTQGLLVFGQGKTVSPQKTPMFFGLVIKQMSVAVDDTAACDGNVFAAKCNDQVLAHPFLVGITEVLRIGVQGIVILHISAGEQNGTDRKSVV